jgi:tRNA C32,U32 (ribose-2'-O)-methylase TrmJ
MLSNIRIVLVETTHPGNIGAVARAMKNMGMDALPTISWRRPGSAAI